MIEPRIYRAAFLPALLAVVVAMFSLESRPPAVPQALAADVLFDGRVALAGARRIAEAHPDRRPQADGNFATASEVASRFRAERFTVIADRFTDEGHDLVNVVGRRIGESPRQVVIVAARDASRVPDVAGSAADTAALEEIARTLQGRATNKTVVLASVDGSTLGSVGARRVARQVAAAGPVEVVIVLSQLGVAHADGPLLVPWSNGTARGGPQLQRTLAESVRLEVQSGGAGRSPGTAGQFARLVLPVGLGDQAPFVDKGLDAVRMSGSGELSAKRQQPADANRLGSLGRATLRTIFAYDAGGEVRESPPSFVGVAQKNLPSWSMALLVMTLLLPVFAAGIDAFARMRRRREPVLPWLRLLVAGTVPFLLALAAAEFLVLVGQAPNPPAIPLPPRANPLDSAGGVSLGICALVFVLAWLFLRPWLGRARRLGAPNTPGAGAALGLALCVVALAVWVVNPFAALALLPAIHIWFLVATSPVKPPRPGGVALVLAGLLVPALVAIGVLTRLSLGPLGGAWYGFQLVTGHQVGLYTAVVASLAAACFGAALRIALARPA